jgi:hypothetical protein
MYRSWAYILMVAATLAGIVALVWPTPPVRTIEEIAMPVRPAPRAETPKAPKPPPKAGPSKATPKPEATPVPPAVLKRMPTSNTTTRRLSPTLENGLQANSFGTPGQDGIQPMAPPAIGGGVEPPPPPPAGNPPPPPRPAVPSRPSVQRDSTK